MAKTSAVERNKKRAKLVARFDKKRTALKSALKSRESSPEERFEAALRLAELPRNSSKTRLHNRCELTGRPHGFYRKFKISRIALRELGSSGQIPGLVKSSW